jgi:hypothetical protein
MIVRWCGEIFRPKMVKAETEIFHFCVQEINLLGDCNKSILKPERLKSLSLGSDPPPPPKKKTKWAVDFGFIQIDVTEQGLEKTKGRQ